MQKSVDIVILFNLIEVYLQFRLYFVFIPISTEKKGILTLVIRGRNLRNNRDVYIFLIRNQKQNFLVNVRLSVRPSVRKTSVH